MRALLYPNTSETGRVYVRVRFGRGNLALPGDKPTVAWAGDNALVASGIGKLRQGVAANLEHSVEERRDKRRDLKTEAELDAEAEDSLLDRGE